MDLIYWYYLGSDKKKVVNNLYRISSVIDLYNASKKGKHEIYYFNVYSINRGKTSKNGEEIIRNWLQISFSDDTVINSKKLKKHLGKIYSMEEFLMKKKYHKKWDTEIWDEFEIEDLIKL